MPHPSRTSTPLQILDAGGDLVAENPVDIERIKSVGRADHKPVLRHGEIVVGAELPLSLSYDHRAIDGAAGRAFLRRLVEAFEAAA